MHLGNLVFKGSEKVTRQLTKFIAGREVCIFENDYSLDDAIKNFYGWCVETKQQINILYMVDLLSMEYIQNIISPGLVIAFMTTGRSEIMGKIIEYIASKPGYNIKVIEVYIDKPVFHRIPDNCAHVQMITLYAGQDEVKEWKIGTLEVIK